MDTYQAIYDAVRSRISNGDIGSAVESAIHTANLSHYAEMAAENSRMVMAEYARPSVLFKPKVFIDGNSWCALYGENLHDGVAGFGCSPDEAMLDFDLNWSTKLAAAPKPGEQP